MLISIRAQWEKKTTGLNYYNCASQTNFAFSIYFKSGYTVNPLHMTHVFTGDTSLKPQIPKRFITYDCLENSDSNFVC